MKASNKKLITAAMARDSEIALQEQQRNVSLLHYEIRLEADDMFTKEIMWGPFRQLLFWISVGPMLNAGSNQIDDVWHLVGHWENRILDEMGHWSDPGQLLCSYSNQGQAAHIKI